jgi:hypothetical protein
MRSPSRTSFIVIHDIATDYPLNLIIICLVA